MIVGFCLVLDKEKVEDVRLQLQLRAALVPMVRAERTRRKPKKNGGLNKKIHWAFMIYAYCGYHRICRRKFIQGVLARSCCVLILLSMKV